MVQTPDGVWLLGSDVRLRVNRWHKDNHERFQIRTQLALGLVHLPITPPRHPLQYPDTGRSRDAR